VPDNPQIRYLGRPRPERLIETVNALSDMGYVHPSPIASKDVEQIWRPNDGGPRDISGAMDGFTKDPSGLMRASGWAIYPTLGRTADCVFITYLDTHNHPIIFAAAQMRFTRRSGGETARRRVGRLWLGSDLGSAADSRLRKEHPLPRLGFGGGHRAGDVAGWIGRLSALGWGGVDLFTFLT